VQDTVNQTGQQVVRKQLDVQPTLTLRAGLPLTILVTRDIVFDD
jgi:type IV secretory pathway VirB10-like protein